MRKTIAAVTAALLALGGVALASTSASAHTGDLDVTYQCDTNTGEYVGTATLAISRTDLAGETKWRVGTESFQGTPNSTSGMDRGPVASSGSGTITLGTFRIPGTTTSKGPWVYAHTTWSDGYKQGSDGQSYRNLSGDCERTKPGQPEPQTTTETRDSQVCAEPKDGTATLTVETRTGTKTPTFDPQSWTWTFPSEWTWGDWAVTSTSQVEDATCDAPPPPVTNVCTEYGTGPTSTNLVPLWGNVDTRSSGHYEYVDGGLRVWTTDSTSQAKVSLGYAASFPLKNTGVLDLDWTGSTPPPGINLFVDFGADGTGTLVYESVYGQDLWLTNGSSAAVKANAPVNGGGNGSQWHGTIDQWLAKYPDATVTGIAFSLGSGVLGDGVIHSITAGCTTYLFDYVEPAPKPEPAVEHRTESVTDCEAGTVTTTEYTRTESDPTFDPTTNTWTRGEFGEWIAGEPEVRDATAEECPVTPTPTPTPPAPTPSATPEPVGGFDTLATTGGDGLVTVGWLTGGALAVALGALLTVLGIRRRAHQD